MAKKPNFVNCSITLVEDKHNAPDFSHYLKLYLNTLSLTPLSTWTLDQQNLPFSTINMYNMFQFQPQTLDNSEDNQEQNIVKAIPKSQELPMGRFDTVIAMIKDEAKSIGVAGVSSFLLSFEKSESHHSLSIY